MKIIYLTNQLTLSEAQKYAREHPKSLAIEYWQKNGSGRKGNAKIVRKIRFVQKVEDDKIPLYRVYDIDDSKVRKVEI